MKKPLLLPVLLYVLSISVLLSSCSKDDGPSYKAENYLNAYLNNFVLQYPDVNGGMLELGTQFSPTVTGKITAIRVKIPQENTQLRVRIWDVELGTIIKTEKVNVAKADTEFVFNIDAIELQKNKSYAITILTEGYYFYRTPNAVNIEYPIKIGNISIEKNIWRRGDATLFPNGLSYDYDYLGDISFDFSITE